MAAKKPTVAQAFKAAKSSKTKPPTPNRGSADAAERDKTNKYKSALKDSKVIAPSMTMREKIVKVEFMKNHQILVLVKLKVVIAIPEKSCQNNRLDMIFQ